VDLTRATWRKSSFSGNNGGACIEIAAVPDWRKSSFSGNNGGDCVEIAAGSHLIAVRDSKDRSGPVLTFTPGDWLAFTRQLKAAEQA
jgi:hypothetical protein